MPITTGQNRGQVMPLEPGNSGREGRRGAGALGVGGSTHFLHDGFSDGLLVLFPLWAEAFGLSLAQVGLLKAVYSGALAGFQVPAGLLAERWGERAVLATGTVVTGLGFVLLGFVDAFPALLLVLLVAGLGSGTQHPLSSSLVAGAFETGRRRAALGVYNFSGDLGKAAVVACLGLAVGAYGWRDPTMAYGALGIIAGVSIFAALKRLDLGVARGPAVAKDAAERGVGWGIHNRRGFLIISAVHMIDSAVRYGFLTFLPFLLMEKGAGVEIVGLALALVFGGGTAGKLLCGVMAERVGVIRTAVLTELATGAGILGIVLAPASTALVLLPLIGFALNGTSSVLYGTVADFVSPDRLSRAFGLFYTLGIGSGAAAPAVLGVLSDAAGIEASLVVLAVGVLVTLPLCLALSTCVAGGPESEAPSRP